MIYQDRGDLAQALEFYQRSLALFEQVGNPAEIAISLYQIGRIYQLRGDLAPALEFYQRTLALSEQVGNPASIVRSLGQISLLQQQRGEMRQALLHVARALALASKIKIPPPLAQQVQRAFFRTLHASPPEHRRAWLAEVFPPGAVETILSAYQELVDNSQ